MTGTGSTGNGKGRTGTSAPVSAAELATLPADVALARVLAITGNNIPAARNMLRQAGCPITIRKADNDNGDGDGDGRYAAHPVNVYQDGFSYSAAGSPGHEQCCATRRRGLYQGARHAGDLPYVHIRMMTMEGRTAIPAYLMSSGPDSVRRVVTWEDVDTGKWARHLSMTRTKNRPICDALNTALDEIASHPDVPERPAALSPSSRTADGRIPAPVWEALPPGYGDQPPDGPGRLAARAAQAAIAARCPQIALAWGAAAAAPFAAAMRVQSCIWELTGPPRRGKTTTVQLQAATWGNPVLPPDPGLMMSWDATAKGPGRLLGSLGILPAFMDESGTADFAPAEWARLVYSFTQGSSRLMSEVNGQSSRKTPGWQGFLFISGNGTITDRVTAGKYAGISARVITLNGPFTATADDARELRAAAEGDYGHVGPAVLDQVTVEDMRGWQRAALGSIGAPDGGTRGTTAEQLAAAVAGAMAIDRVLGTGSQVAAAAMSAARDYLAAAAEPEPDAARVLRTLSEWLSSNRPAWADRRAYEALGQPALGGAVDVARHGYQSTLDGLTDDTFIYVYSHAWTRLIDETGVTESTVRHDLYAAGHLAVPDGWRRKGEWTAPAPNWARKTPTHKIRISAIEAAADDGPGDDGRQDHAAEPAPGTDVLANTPAAADVPPAAAPAAAPAPEPLPLAPASVAPAADPWAAEQNAMAAYYQDTTASAGNSEPAAPGMISARESLAAARERLMTGSKPWNGKQWEAFQARAEIMADPAIGDHPERLRILAALEGRQDNSEQGRGRIIPGPFAPRLGKRGPYLQPWGDGAALRTAESALIVSAWAWQREDYAGPAVVLDRTGSWVAGFASAQFAHGALAHAGPWDGQGTPRPGYYQVDAYPWTEAGMPSPLGPARPGDRVWIPAPAMYLLRDLADAGRWPDAGAADSWTGDPCRLDQWAALTRELRRHAIEVYGRDSDAYGSVKQAFGQAVSLLKGGWAEDSAMPRRVWKCAARRLDWPDHAETAAAAAMWRRADECRQLAEHAGTPELAPVAVGRNTDELVIPAAALDLMTTGILPGKTRPPVRLDPLGIELGTYKIKGREDW